MDGCRIWKEVEGLAGGKLEEGDRVGRWLEGWVGGLLEELEDNWRMAHRWTEHRWGRACQVARRNGGDRRFHGG